LICRSDLSQLHRFVEAAAESTELSCDLFCSYFIFNFNFWPRVIIVQCRSDMCQCHVVDPSVDSLKSLRLTTKLF